MSDYSSHWSSDPYWTDALASYYRLREAGVTEIKLDLSKLESILTDGGSPAYRLMEAMHSVRVLEGMDGYRGAPRLVLALLAMLSTDSGDMLHTSQR